jgi:hypothetical protein
MDRGGKEYVLDKMIQYFFGNRKRPHDEQKAEENCESDAGISHG